MKKAFAIALAVAGALVLAQLPAMADTIAVQGTASGVFSAGTPGQLTYAGSSFANPAATDGTLLNLGSFTLASCLACSFDNKTFTLTTTFTLPGSGGTMTANLTGGMIVGTGGLTIDFGSNTKSFTFSNSTGSGSFDLSVPDIGYTLVLGAGGGTKQLNGKLSNVVFNPVPEPASIALFGSVLAGFGLWLKRRKA